MNQRENPEDESYQNKGGRELRYFIPVMVLPSTKNITIKSSSGTAEQRCKADEDCCCAENPSIQCKFPIHRKKWIFHCRFRVLYRYIPAPAVASVMTERAMTGRIAIPPETGARVVENAVTVPSLTMTGSVMLW